MVCRRCRETNRAGARFCRACGEVLEAEGDAGAPAASGPEQVRRLAGPRKRLIAVVAATGVVIVVIGAIAFGGGDKPDATSTPLNLATVRRTKLVSVQSLDGEVVARGEGPPVISRLGGTVTEIAAEGSRIARGQTLYSINGQPVVLLYGSLPAWRDIGGPNISDGADVRQLEENLRALGFETGVVDQTFTEETRSAVNEWLSSFGLARADVVRLGRVVFARAALAVAKHLKVEGAPVADGDEILATVSSEKVVQVTLANERDLTPGAKVAIALPGEKVPAKVTSVGTPTTGGAPDELRPQATVVPDAVGALDELEEGADADIEVSGEARENALVVPVTALVARRRGGYAVEVYRGPGRTEFVAVTTGLYAVNLVEVRGGDLEEGDRVVVP